MDSRELHQPDLGPPVVPAAVSSLSARSVHGGVTTARVLAAYPFGVYLELGGTVLPVLSTDAVALPTSLRVAARAGEIDWGVAAGDEVAVGGGRVRFPAVHLHAARTWSPPRVRVLTPTEAARTSAGRTSLAHHMRHRVALDAPSASRGSCGGGGEDRGWLADGIRALVASRAPGEQVGRLVGRGPGLTPAGDDAIAGALLVEVALGSLPMLASAVRPRLRATTAVSRALLSAACEGYAAPSVVALVDAAVGGDEAALAVHLPRVLAIGHTSGHDLVTGVLAALGAGHRSSARSAA